jgi:hypothetical protein
LDKIRDGRVSALSTDQRPPSKGSYQVAHEKQTERDYQQGNIRLSDQCEHASQIHALRNPKNQAAGNNYLNQKQCRVLTLHSLLAGGGVRFRIDVR